MTENRAEDVTFRSSVDQLRVLKAGDLFQGDRAVLIDFQGTTYKLRITTQNKLILTKPEKSRRESKVN
jgi:hemin uptake protein HemP